MIMVRTLVLLLLAATPVAAHAVQPVQVCQANWQDPGRSDRVIPVRIRMPAGTGRLPVILFSHGLGGNLDSGTDWVNAWAAAGFITVNMQHVGSDDALWKNQARPLLAMRGAMNPEQLKARADDVHFVLDRIAQGGHVGTCDLGRADMNEIGMSGHSFGAETTLAVSGGNYTGATRLLDPRIKASIAFSPQPSPGEDDHAAFGGIGIPVFSITGTKDSFAQYGGVSVADRTRPYQAMPAGQKYLLIVDGASHLMLNGQTLPSARMTPTPAMVDTIDQSTILFWQAALKDDHAAAGRLQTLQDRLPPADRLTMK
jgi:predicted dienelactone hydrolase